MELTLNDAVMSALAPFDGTNNDKQVAFLQFLLEGLDPPADATLDDLWALVMDYVTPGSLGTLQERKCAYFRSSLGDIAGTYNEIERLWWIAQIPP